MNKINVFETGKLDKQLSKTEKSEKKATEDREKLKQLFKMTYNTSTVMSILNLIIKCGTDEDKNFAKKFDSNYQSGNLSTTEIRVFKKMLIIYQNEINEIWGKEEEK